MVWRCAGSLNAYNEWLLETVEEYSERERVRHVKDIFGFFMGFRKDHPVSDSSENILMRGGSNLHQGEWSTW
jgi:hypothetical protein